MWELPAVAMEAAAISSSQFHLDRRWSYLYLRYMDGWDGMGQWGDIGDQLKEEASKRKQMAAFIYKVGIKS